MAGTGAHAHVHEPCAGVYKKQKDSTKGEKNQHNTNEGIVQVSDVTMQETLRDEPTKMHRQARLGHPSSQGKPMPTIVPYTDLLNTYPWVAITTLLTCHVHGLVYTRGVCTEKYDPGSFQDHM